MRMGSKRCFTQRVKRREKGSTSLVALGLLAALIVVLCIPFIVNIGEKTEHSLGCTLQQGYPEDGAGEFICNNREGSSSTGTGTTSGVTSGD